MYLPILPQYLPQIQLYLHHITMHFPSLVHCIFPKFRCQKYCFFCHNRPLYFKIFFWQRETRAQRTNVKSHCGGRASSQILPQCQLGNCQVHLASHARLGVLGSLLVDIGLKLYSVHFAVKLSSASAAPLLRRTWLQSAPRAVSTQVRQSPFSSRPCLAALDSADLKRDLGRLKPESVKSPSLHSTT